MTDPARTPLSPKKLLKTKWTAVRPVNKEKHFLVIAVVEPVPPEAPVVDIDLQAVHSGRVQRMAWRTLTDAAVWKRGWV